MFNQMVEELQMDQLSQAFAALADSTRRDLVARLAVGDATVGELAAPYDMSVQAVSKHLSVLERAGLVSKSKQGQRRPVRLEGQVLDLMTKWIERYQPDDADPQDKLVGLIGRDPSWRPGPLAEPKISRGQASSPSGR